MYVRLMNTDTDHIFDQIALMLHFNDQLELLKEHGFYESEIARKGVHSQGIVINEKYLIKFFVEKPSYIHNNFQLFSNFTEYEYLKQLQDLQIQGIPTIYGYAPNNFMVVEFCGLLNLRPSNVPSLNLIEAEQLLEYLYRTFWDIYLSTNTLPDDMLQKNIVYQNGEFTFVDYSLIAAFNSDSFAKSYLVHRLNFLFLRMYHAQQLSAYTYLEIKRKIDMIEHTKEQKNQ